MLARSVFVIVGVKIPSVDLEALPRGLSNEFIRVAGETYLSFFVHRIRTGLRPLGDLVELQDALTEALQILVTPNDTDREIIKKYGQISVHIVVENIPGEMCCVDPNPDLAGSVFPPSAPFDKTKKARSPDQPKRGKNAYLFYIDDRRTRMTDVEKQMANKNFIRLVGTEWNQLPDVERKKYQEMQRQAKHKYTSELATYRSQQSPTNDTTNNYDGDSESI